MTDLEKMEALVSRADAVTAAIWHELKGLPPEIAKQGLDRLAAVLHAAECRAMNTMVNGKYPRGEG